MNKLILKIGYNYIFINMRELLKPIKSLIKKNHKNIIKNNNSSNNHHKIKKYFLKINGLGWMIYGRFLVDASRIFAYFDGCCSVIFLEFLREGGRELATALYYTLY